MQKTEAFQPDAFRYVTHYPSEKETFQLDKGSHSREEVIEGVVEAAAECARGRVLNNAEF